MIIRPRRLRRIPSIRDMVRETDFTVKDFIFPLFVKHGSGIKTPILSMPGQYHFSPDTVIEEVREIHSLGIPAVLIFGLPEKKDPIGSCSYQDDGVVQKSVSAIKEKFPDMVVITDVCLCEYTDHGHCGILRGDQVDNDATVEILSLQALSHARAGADFVAPSDMMDGRIGVIRKQLDLNHFQDTGIISYAVKYASAFFGPFREAADSAPGFGDRSGYQMDPANAREAMKEAILDMEEGADMIMIKPALTCLDIISRVREKCLLPLVAYNVSGEYSMIKSAEKLGWLDGTLSMMEVLTCIKRAGADLIITYFAKQAAVILNRD